MALFECPECKHMISDRAVACPSCGNPLIPSASPYSEPAKDQEAQRPIEAVVTPSATPPPSALNSTTQSFLFGKMYACICFFGCLISGCLGVLAALHIIRTGDWLNNTSTQRNTGELLAMIFMFALWSSTGVAILRRKKFAIPLTYVGAVVAGLGILARG